MINDRKSFILILSFLGIIVFSANAQKEKPKPFEYAKLFTEKELKTKRLYANLGASTIKQYKEVFKLRLRSMGGFHGKIDAIPSFVDTLKNLQYLYVRGEALTTLPLSMEACKNMQFLHLSSNRFTEIPQVIFTFKHLKLLDLRANSFKEIPFDIGNFSELEYLYLGQNSALTLLQLDAMKKLTKLKNLDLTGTNIPLRQAKEIQKLLPNCKVLHD
ncbi:leucine-rich repeat domain-containing protein [Microscilla marina]|uniref:Cytoplasmic membrane protein n=1 Tax=Microscilla marina ATCC 23134 TaxID=313606 RepID=A1ZT45_MICM2|nr:leucine-rich repeat domain-containing protein [Microscilla marina]EAY26435.1 cytoplasmic membrane protein [Microscilla marina ATCC 23134]